MGFGDRNNCLFFYGPITSLGDKNEVQTAIAICQDFDLICIGVHVGGDLPNLNKVIAASKTSRPGQLWYGYVPFGSTGSGVSAASCDQWMVDCPPSSGLLDGIFLDEFGHDFPSGDRDQQNGIVNYCHDTLNDGSTTGLPVFVNPWVPTDVFAQIPNNSNNAAPVVGSDASFKDIVLVESFVYGVDASTPPKRGDWTRDLGRIKYFFDQRDNNSKNIHVCAMIGAGQGTGINTNTSINQKIYRQTLSYLDSENCNYVCVNHGDLGATSHSFFYQHVENIFPLVVPSGNHKLTNPL